MHSVDIDAFLALLYSVRMTDNIPQSVTEQELLKLEVRLEELVSSIERLKDSMVTERAGLIEKNEMARSRVEAMINRLKSMEQGA